MKIIKRGAEAVIYLSNDNLIKERIKKGYRISEIDLKLRKERTRKEVKLMSEVRRIGVNVPNIIEVDEKSNKIVMKFIDGYRLKELLNETSAKIQEQLAEEMGKSVGLMHSNGIVHGDLTTSNMILKDKKIYFIDFGLGEFSKRIEDLATDLSVLKEAFKSTHFKHLSLLWQSFIKGYNQTNTKSEEVLGKLEEIEKRGRYVRRGNGRTTKNGRAQDRRA